MAKPLLMLVPPAARTVCPIFTCMLETKLGTKVMITEAMAKMTGIHQWYSLAALMAASLLTRVKKPVFSLSFVSGDIRAFFLLLFFFDMRNPFAYKAKTTIHE